MDHLKALIREVPDFPRKGILFYDITTLLKDKVGFRQLIDALAPTPLPLFHAAKLVGTSAGRRHDEQQTNLAGTAFPC